MSSTKRVSGDYNIYAGPNVAGTYTGTVTIHGNLTVMGTQTAVESQDTLITDRIITLNNGEVGAGVTGLYSGIEIDRGSLTNTAIRWNESTVRWEATIDGTTWVDIITGIGGLATAAGSNTHVQFNDAGYLGANSAFTFDKVTGTLSVGNVSITDKTISTVATNANLTIDPNGTGSVRINSAVRLEELAGDPTYEATHTWLYAKAPSGGRSGLFFVNSNNESAELLSKTVAKKLALIF